MSRNCKKFYENPIHTNFHEGLLFTNQLLNFYAENDFIIPDVSEKLSYNNHSSKCETKVDIVCLFALYFIADYLV